MFIHSAMIICCKNTHMKKIRSEHRLWIPCDESWWSDIWTRDQVVWDWGRHERLCCHRLGVVLESSATSPYGHIVIVIPSCGTYIEMITARFWWLYICLWCCCCLLIYSKPAEYKFSILFMWVFLCMFRDLGVQMFCPIVCSHGGVPLDRYSLGVLFSAVMVVRSQTGTFWVPNCLQSWWCALRLVQSGRLTVCRHSGVLLDWYSVGACLQSWWCALRVVQSGCLTVSSHVGVLLDRYSLGA